MGLTQFYGQNKSVDSLLTILKTTQEDTNKVNVLNLLSVKCIALNNYGQAIQYADEARQLSEKIAHKKGAAFAYGKIGSAYWYKGSYEKAIENLLKSLKIREEIGDKKGVVTALRNIAFTYMIQGNHKKALENFIKTLKITEEIGDQSGVATCYLDMGNVFMYEGNYQKAHDTNLKALNIFEIIKNKDGIADAYKNIGNIYIVQGNYEQAASSLLKAIKVKEQSENKNGLGFFYDDISTVYIKEGYIANSKMKLTKACQNALYYQLKSLKIKQDQTDDRGIAISYNTIGIIYMRENKLEESYNYLIKALNLFNETKNKEGIKDSYSSLTDLFEKKNDLKQSLKYHRLYSDMKDSLLNEQSSKLIAEMQTKYETEKKDEEIKLQQLHLQEKDYQMYGLIAGAFLVLIITVLLTQQYRYRAKQRTIELQQKLLRSQMNPHFLFKSLFSIQSYMLDNNAEDAAIYLAKFAELMRQILDNSREEYIPLRKETETLENYLELQKLRYENKFDYEIIVDENIDLDFTLIPPMLSQPFIENAIEHGFSKKMTGGKITVSFSLQEEDILFVVQDNGIGVLEAEYLKTALKKHKSLATTIVKERLSLLNRRKRKKIKLDITDLSIASKGNLTGTRISFLVPEMNS